MAPRRRKPRRLTPEEELAAIEAEAGELRKLIKAKRRFAPEAVRKHRHRLGINATQYGALIQVQMGTIYGWEQGRFGPKPDQLLRWVALTRTGDKAALAPLRLEEVRRVSPRQLRAERKRLGLSQERYGALVGSGQATMSTWETAKRKLARTTVRKLEAIWGISRAEARRRLVQGIVARAKPEPRRRTVVIKPPPPSRSWPPDPETALARTEERMQDLRALVKIRMQFSPEAIRRHRQSLGLSAARYGKLLGVFMQTVYGWEKGRFRPKPELLRKWVALTGMSKKQGRGWEKTR